MDTKTPKRGQEASRVARNKVARLSNKITQDGEPVDNSGAGGKPALTHDVATAFDFLRLLASPASPLVTLTALGDDKPATRTFDMLDGDTRADLKGWLAKRQASDIYFHPNSSGEDATSKHNFTDSPARNGGAFFFCAEPPFSLKTKRLYFNGLARTKH